MSGRGIVEAGVFRSELIEANARTSDPTNPGVGDFWIRSDVQPSVVGATTVGALRIQGAGGVLEVPFFDAAEESNLGADVYVGERFRFDDGTVGFIAETDQGGSLGSPRLVVPDGTEYQAHDALELSAIPDSVVSREADNVTATNVTGARGVRFSVSQEWPKFQGELSGNYDGSCTRAYIYRVSDGTLMGDADISTLTSGDVITVNLDNILSSGDYNFVLDAEGSQFNTAYDDFPSFPYTSSDGNLSIINGALNATDTVPNAFFLLTIGNINL